jgi:hypothetical protein
METFIPWPACEVGKISYVVARVGIAGMLTLGL